MELNRKRKIMIGVLALGVGALVVDRFVLGPPNAAQAAGPWVTTVDDTPGPDANPVPSDAPAITSAPPGDASVLPDYAGLAEKLAALAPTDPDGEAINLFAEPEHWAPAQPDATPQAPAVSAGPIVSSKLFLETYQLTRVTETQRGTIAQVNGRTLAVGDTLENFVLKGFIDQASLGRAALWESLRDGQMVVMPTAR